MAVPSDGPRAPLVVASVGTHSGPAATVLAPNLWGAQLWARAVNERGGLNGHPVKLIAYDDNFDPARHRSVVQEAIERRGAVAFVSMATAASTQETVDYITAKKVPVLGSFGGTLGFYTSPMYFPQQPHYDPLFRSWVQSVAQQLVPMGKTKLGILHCSESSLCADIERQFSTHGGKYGLEVVYRGRGALAQPDFTAECLAARNSGAEAMVVILDGNSLNRYAASCARQGFKPQYAVVASVILERHKDDPNLDGAVGVSNVFPWFQSGTPATDEYQRALATYGKGLGNGVGLATGWVAGKLLEQAGANLPEPPTSAAILQGLWAFRNVDLGGIAMPMTFEANRPATPSGCWWNLKIAGGKWTSPDGYQRHCNDL